MTISAYLREEVPFFGLYGRIHRAGGTDAVARMVGVGPGAVFLAGTPLRSPAVTARIDRALPRAGTKPRWAVWARTALAAGILASLAGAALRLMAGSDAWDDGCPEGPAAPGFPGCRGMPP